MAHRATDDVASASASWTLGWSPAASARRSRDREMGVGPNVRFQKSAHVDGHATCSVRGHESLRRWVPNFDRGDVRRARARRDASGADAEASDAHSSRIALAALRVRRECARDGGRCVCGEPARAASFRPRAHRSVVREWPDRRRCGRRADADLRGVSPLIVTGLSTSPFLPGRPRHARDIVPRIGRNVSGSGRTR